MKKKSPRDTIETETKSNWLKKRKKHIEEHMLTERLGQ